MDDAHSNAKALVLVMDLLMHHPIQRPLTLILQEAHGHILHNPPVGASVSFLGVTQL